MVEAIINKEINRDYFVNKVLELRLNCNIDDINTTNASLNQYKELTINILNATKTTGTKYGMKYISNIIDQWKETVVRDLWKKEIYDYCLTHDDISAALSVLDEDKRAFVIIMNDSTSDNVITYNEFGFDMIKKYHDDIFDFMILDKSTAKGLEDLFSGIESIYIKG